MSEDNSIQKENETQVQFQEPKQQQSKVESTQQERMEFVKLTRYTSLASGRIAESLMKMTSRLEDEGFLRCDRPSRLKRDKKLRQFSMKLQKSDTDINNMMKLIPNHPDGEKMIQSLFKGIRNFSPNAEGSNIPLDENNQQQQVNVNNQIQNESNELLSETPIPNENSASTDAQQNNDQLVSEELEKNTD